MHKSDLNLRLNGMNHLEVVPKNYSFFFLQLVFPFISYVGEPDFVCGGNFIQNNLVDAATPSPKYVKVQSLQGAGPPCRIRP